MTERVPGKPEIMDLPLGTEVTDSKGHVWKRGRLDGSCIKLLGEKWAIVRFYTPVHEIDGVWYLGKKP